MLRVLPFLLALVAACSAAPPTTSAPPPPPQPPPAEIAQTVTAVIDGRAVIDAYQCTSCHEIAGPNGQELERPSGGRDCYGCHREVALGTFSDRPQMHEQWKRELPHKFDVPSLRGAQRFQRKWLIEYLQRPHDVRHNLESQMPRMPIDAAQAAAIADFLGATDAPSSSEALGDPASGEQLFRSFACGACHGAVPEAVPRPVVLAPHLGHAIRRLGFRGVVAWIQDPAAQKVDTLMPRLGLSEQQAVDLAAYLSTLTPPPLPPRPDRVPHRLRRIVEWKEVYRGLLRQRCLHCHNRPQSSGMGGPGYTGGWGYEGKSQSLFTYDQVMSGGRDSDGNPRSLFDPIGDDGLPRIVAHLVARHEEVAGADPAIVGMPLGQPPVPWEKIDALYTWILQGRLR